jgi:hypothetical protein
MHLKRGYLQPRKAAVGHTTECQILQIRKHTNNSWLWADVSSLQEHELSLPVSYGPMTTPESFILPENGQNTSLVQLHSESTLATEEKERIGLRSGVFLGPGINNGKTKGTL